MIAKKGGVKNPPFFIDIKKTLMDRYTTRKIYKNFPLQHVKKFPIMILPNAVTGLSS